MALLLRCSCGHQWQSDAASHASENPCPMCGVLVSARASLATLLPTTVNHVVAGDAQRATTPPGSTTETMHDGSALAPPGYEILGELGRGGMGVVYKARQIKASRLVALKMILAGNHAGADQLARFRIEAEAVARLQHPGIVQVFEVGEHKGLPFFSLEFCPGGSLQGKLAGTPLQPQEAAKLVEKLARGLQAAHEARILHRDLKPANVLLAADGTPKIADFGLAKKLDEQGQTVSGVIMGTPSYLAPEQADGRSKSVGPAADVYAMGVILYECLTGHPPFRAATILDTLQQVIAREPVPPRQMNARVPRDLDTIALKCLRKEPSRRYGSAAELADDLGRYLRKEPIRARRTGLLERTAKWVRRNPLGAALLLVLATGVAASTWFAIEARQQAAAARKTADDLAEETRNLARSREETEAILIEALVRPLSATEGPLLDVEIDALRRLRKLPRDRLRLAYLEEGLRTAEAARRLDHRAAWIVQAVIGLDRQQRKAAQELVVRRLQSADATAEIRNACIKLGAALEVRDAAFDAAVGPIILAEAARRLDCKEFADLPDRIEIVSHCLDDGACNQLGEMLTKALSQTNDDEALQSLAKALRLVSDRIDRSVANRAADVLLQVIERTNNRYAAIGRLGNWRLFEELSETLDGVSNKLDAVTAAKHAQLQTDRILRALTKKQKACYGGAESLRKPSLRLDNSAIRSSADALLALIAQPGDGIDLAQPCHALAVLSNRLDADQANKAAEVLLQALRGASDTSARFHLATALEAVGSRLDCPTIETIVDDLVATLPRTTKVETFLQLFSALHALCPRFDEIQATKVADGLVSVMSRAAPTKAFLPLIQPLCQLLAAANAYLDSNAAAVRANKAADLLLVPLRGRSDAVAIHPIALAFQYLGDQLDAVHADQVASALLSAMDRCTDPTRQIYLSVSLANVIARLNAAVATAHANKAVDVILNGLNKSSDARFPTNVAIAARSLYRYPDGDHVRKILDALAPRSAPLRPRDALYRNWAGSRLSCEAIATLSGRLDGAEGRDHTSKAVDTLLTGVNQTPSEVDLKELKESLLGMYQRRTTTEIVALLRHPLAAGPAQRALLDLLGRRTHRHFRTTWHFLDWAQSNGIDFDSARSG